jgi:ABC-2 type transport system permease protein
VVIPASSYGSFGDVARYLPSGALGESMRFALLDHGVDATGLLTLLGWGLLGTALTAKTFRWE